MKIKRDTIVDLSFYEGMSISELEIDAPGITNVAALNGNTSLRKLSINFGISGRDYEEIKLMGLNNLPSLKTLELGDEIKKIEFVCGLANLEELSLSGCESLEGLEGTYSLKRIELRGTSLKSLKPIEKLKLNSLSFFVFSFSEVMLEELFQIIEVGAVLEEVSIDKCYNLYNDIAPRPMEHDISSALISKFKKSSKVRDVNYNPNGYFGDSLVIKMNK
jgi:hypothetical protein